MELEKNEVTSSNEQELVSKDKILESGAYFGHKKSLRNPKMDKYILGNKRNISIIDVNKTKKTLEFSFKLIEKLAEKGANFIFVGTRRQAKETIKYNALRTNSSYVSERWLGGTLTNSETILSRVNRMVELEKMAENNFEGYTKKEGVLLSKQLAKLQRNLSGIRNMKTKPNIMIVADVANDHIAIKEAVKSKIKVIGIVDSNNDPSNVDVVIPANDDSVKSVTLIITLLADAIAKGKDGSMDFAFKKDSEIILPEDKKVVKTKPYNKFNKRPMNNRTNKFVKTDNEAKPVSEKPKTEVSQ